MLRESGTAGIWTHDLSIASPTPYRSANTQQSLTKPIGHPITTISNTMQSICDNWPCSNHDWCSQSDNLHRTWADKKFIPVHHCCYSWQWVYHESSREWTEQWNRQKWWSIVYGNWSLLLHMHANKPRKNVLFCLQSTGDVDCMPKNTTTSIPNDFRPVDFQFPPNLDQFQKKWDKSRDRSNMGSYAVSLSPNIHDIR